MACTPQELADAAKCFNCLSEKQLLAIIAQLSCESGGGESGVLRYRALLTQTGTDAPVVTVLENTLGGTVVWTRDGPGDYSGTLVGAFPATKTFTFGNLGQGYNNTNPDFLGIAVAAEGDVLRVVTDNSDDLLLVSSVGCDVYP